VFMEVLMNIVMYGQTLITRSLLDALADGGRVR
jgi:hypothetical protein